MRVVYAVGKGLIAYGVGFFYVAHLLAARHATEVAIKALDEGR